MLTGHADNLVANGKEAIEPLLTGGVQVRFHLFLTKLSRASLNLDQ